MCARSIATLSLVVSAVGVTSIASAQYQQAQYQQPYAYAPPAGYYRNDTAEGTFLGGGLGALAGAIIGSSNGESPEGALIGAGIGAITGNLLGRSQDAADRQQAAYGFAATQQANARAAAQAVTNYDLMQMTQAGLADNVIVAALQTRGSALDLSPNGLIALKQAGVSDYVVATAQRSAGPAVVASRQAGPTVVIDRRPVIAYPPRPRVYFGAHYGRGGRFCW